MKIYQAPYLPMRITSPFGRRSTANLPSGGTAQHDGIDIGRDLSKYSNHLTTMPAGAVFAVLDGTVTDSKFINGRGYTVIIDHGNKTKTLYQHLHQNNLVKTGTKVKAGDTIGFMGRSGMTNMSVHLHFELLINNKPVDPMPYFDFKGGSKHMVEKGKIVLNGKIKTVDLINEKGSNYIKVQDLRDHLISIGYKDKMPVIQVNK